MSNSSSSTTIPSTTPSPAPTVAPKMSDLKEQVINFKTKIYGGSGVCPRTLGVILLTKVIPRMFAVGDVAFGWHWAANDVGVYNQAEYDAETKNYRTKHKMMKNDGDTTWFYDFKNGDKKVRAIITTEIWFKKDEDHNTSPVAILLGQFFGAGLHLAKVRFEVE